MANVFAIHSVGNSFMTYLTRSYPDSLRASHPCSFALVSSDAIHDFKIDETAKVTFLLYRVMMNEHMRNASRLTGLSEPQVPLMIDLHYMMTVWAQSALTEQVVLAWVMRQIYLRPTLDQSVLSPEAGWNADDSVQILPSELSNEDMMRIWDAINPSYHLTVPYIARVVRIDPDPTSPGLPVVATRFGYGEMEKAQ
jgi:hypothetical protein